MNRARRLIINCGFSRVTAAVISTKNGSLYLDKCASEVLEYDFSDGSAYNDALAKGLKALMRDHGFRGRATFIISGNEVLAKTILVPCVEPEKQAEVIAYEVQEAIPYPLSEVVWDSQVISDDGVEKRVLLVVSKISTIHDFCETVATTGLKIDAISAATVLEYNALKYSYANTGEETLLINVGVRSTNLFFSNAGGFFTRNIALGGNSLTQTIADKLGKSFIEAEEVKQAFVSGDLKFAEDDPTFEFLKTSTDLFVRRIGQEVGRSVVSYRRQRKVDAVERIFLSGNSSLYESLGEHLAEKQKAKVEIFDPLQNLNYGNPSNLDSEILRLSLGEIVGEASTHLIAGGTGVNLLPEEMRKQVRFAGKKPILILAAICLALAPWPLFLALKNDVFNARLQSEETRSEVNSLESRQLKIEENIQKALALQESISRVEGLANSKVNWIQFFAELQNSLFEAKDVWLDDLEVVREEIEEGEFTYEVILSGQMLVRETAEGADNLDREFLSSRIKELQVSLESSEFIVEAKEPQIFWDNLFDGLNVLPFRINLVVDSAKPL